MGNNIKTTYAAYKCPECGETTVGIIGEAAFSVGMLRLKCKCGGSNMDIFPTDAEKFRVTIPCVLCKDNHNLTVSRPLILNRDEFELLCPYSNFPIGFFGTEEGLNAFSAKCDERLQRLLTGLELETLSDLQPEEMSDAEILPDAAVYDMIRLVLKDLEAEGRADCPCHYGTYDLRYTDDGLQAYCDKCGAVYDFHCHSELSAEKYLYLDEIKLS